MAMWAHTQHNTTLVEKRMNFTLVVAQKGNDSAQQDDLPITIYKRILFWYLRIFPLHFITNSICVNNGPKGHKDGVCICLKNRLHPLIRFICNGTRETNKSILLHFV